jgi:hypothetical protein
VVLSKIANHQEPKNNKNVSESIILYLYQVQKTRISCGTTFLHFSKKLKPLGTTQGTVLVPAHFIILSVFVVRIRSVIFVLGTQIGTKGFGKKTVNTF